MEIRAWRSSATAARWYARQVIFTSNGVKRLVPVHPQFYFAGDGHRHWHIRDFDSYELLQLGTGTVVQGHGEKHGFCLEDNTTYRDWPDNRQLHPGMPLRAVYRHATSCGHEDGRATRIVHGISVGWGDTYPTTLVDQSIDITAVPDGTYQVRVTADGQRLLNESDRTNNSATSTIAILGNTVTWVSDDGGL
jgi:Lysyl oxidase